MPINKEGTIHCYDVVAPLYSFVRKKTYKSDNNIMPFVLDMLDLKEGETVLDAGTGPGIYAIRIAQRTKNADIHGVDLSPTFLKLAQKNAREAGLRHIKFSQGDLENLPFVDDHFNKLICAGAISAVPDKERAAREIHRVLKSGGRAIVTEPNKGKNIRDRAFLYLLYGLGLVNPKLRGFCVEDMQQYYFSRESLYDLFKTAGFGTVRVFERAGSFCAVCLK